MSPGRIAAMMSAVVGLIGAVIGALAPRRGAGDGEDHDADLVAASSSRCGNDPELSSTAEGGNLLQLFDQWVRTAENLGHRTFISSSDFPQLVESRCGYAGSNKSISVKSNSVGKEQLLEPLALVERNLHPEVGGAWQNAFCERQDAFYVEFFELA